MAARFPHRIATVGRLEVDWHPYGTGFASPRYWWLSWHRGISYSRVAICGLEFWLNRWRSF